MIYLYRRAGCPQPAAYIICMPLRTAGRGQPALRKTFIITHSYLLPISVCTGPEYSPPQGFQCIPTE